MTPVEAIRSSALAAWVNDAPGVFTTLQAVHTVGFALLFGSVVVYHLRVLGLGRSVSPRQLARQTLPWTGASLLLVIPSGFLMFAGAADELIENRAFVWKIGLLMLAGTNACLYHMLYRENHGEPVWLARLQSIASLIIWVAIIFCGRWISAL